MDKFKTNLTDNLCRAILSLENMEECYKFFEDVCTIKEIQEIAQRLEVARLLKEKRAYNDVAKATGASTATISRVNKCISYGTGGYDIVLERLGNDKD
ncbi:MAG: hypothetical protein IKU87_00310 [Clostridia bacterium]|nr:hypothetical protein [Clostridia bacterium]